MSEPFVRTSTTNGRKYRQLVQWYPDPGSGRRRLRILESLGPVHPVHRRSLVPWSAPLLLAHMGLLASKLVTGELDGRDIVDLLHDMGLELPPGRLLAAGVRYDLVKKTAEPLELLLWLAPPWSGVAAAAPPAGRGRAARGRNSRRS